MSNRGVRRLGVRAALVGGVIVPGDIEITAGHVAALGMGPAGGADLLALPGFVDLQVNGFAGVDLLHADVADHGTVAAALARTGVTAYQPTFISAPLGTTVAALATLARVRGRGSPGGAQALAAHLEGPFLSPRWCGAHDAGHLIPASVAAADALCDAGPVGMLTLAPELDDALSVIAHLRRRGVTVSLGHSNATAAIAAAAFDAGATAVTHVLNAMRPITAREPGLAGAALATAGVTVMAIVDGVHLASGTISIILAAARGRVCLVTDAMAAAGVGDGDFHLGGRPVHVSAGAARLEGGVLAGSVLTMDAAVRNLVAHGVPLAQAVDAATRAPARLLGDRSVGQLRVGGRADIAVVDAGLSVRRTLVGGVEAYAG